MAEAKHMKAYASDVGIGYIFSVKVFILLIRKCIKLSDKKDNNREGLTTVCTHEGLLPDNNKNREKTQRERLMVCKIV